MPAQKSKLVVEATVSKISGAVINYIVQPCSDHPEKEPVCFCPVCRGQKTSARKALSSRQNGLFGGRPRKKTTKKGVNRGRKSKR